MLVRAFQVEVGRLAEATLQQHAFVGHAGVEPDIEDVGDLVVVLRLVAQQFGGVQRVPDIDAALLHAVGDRAHQLDAARMRLAGLAVHEQRDRHAPGTLARDGPVRPAIDHAGDAGFAPLREPADLLDRFQRIGAQVGLLHRDEPLRRGAERDRRLVAPAVRIAVLHLAEGEQHAALLQHVDDDVVGLPDMQSGQLHAMRGRCGRQVDAAAIDRVELGGGVLVQQAVLLADHVVFLAVAGGGVHGAGTVFGRHVIAQQHGDVARVVERVREQQAFQRAALHPRVHDHIGNAVALQRARRERIGQHQPAALAVVRRTFDQGVFQLTADGDRQRRRQRPRRGGPDRQSDLDIGRHRGTECFRDRLRIARGVGDIDGGRDLVGVFDLGLGQRRAAVEAPVHRLHAAGQVAVGDDLGQRTDLVRFEAEIERLVRVVPVADHAQALEVPALEVDLRLGVFAALLPELDRIQLHADLAELLLDGDLDRQAVAVPAGDVGRIEAGQVFRLDDDVLQDLVDRMAQVDRTVGVRRAVVQHKQRAALGVLAQLRVQALAFPAGQGVGLALGQVATHREIRGGQMKGRFVVLAHAVARR